jgi:polar amino acid transport system permease protein
MSATTQRPPTRSTTQTVLSRTPYWLLTAMLLGVLFVWHIQSDESYRVIFATVSKGLWVTIWVTVVSYIGAMILGLLVALARGSRNRVVYEVATFYVEIVRGVPMLVLLLYIAFVVAPALVGAINWFGQQLAGVGLGLLGDPLAGFRVRDLDYAARAIIALVIAYSAFLSEIFRAGIESIERGQVEAAYSLGMSRWLALRLVVLPQAVRRVLPPLGNDFIAMLKDSSLVSVLGVADITRLGDTYATSTFLYFQTYNVVAFLYLTMTLMLTLAVRWLERRMPQNMK